MIQDVHVKLNTRIAIAKEALGRKKILFTSKLDLNLRKKISEMLYLEHSVVLC